MRILFFDKEKRKSQVSFDDNMIISLLNFEVLKCSCMYLNIQTEVEEKSRPEPSSFDARGSSSKVYSNGMSMWASANWEDNSANSEATFFSSTFLLINDFTVLRDHFVCVCVYIYNRKTRMYQLISSNFLFFGYSSYLKSCTNKCWHVFEMVFTFGLKRVNWQINATKVTKILN